MPREYTDDQLANQPAIQFRNDLSSKVIHFTKGVGSKDSDEYKKRATANFFSILREAKIKGSSNGVKSGEECICFTECPLAIISMGFSDLRFPYAPLGVMVTKRWLFKKGGRPVIYQPDCEFDFLKQEQRYRHKEYDPIKGEDHTWEREWRLRDAAFYLKCAYEKDSEEAEITVIVPNRKWIEFFKQRHQKMTQGLMRGRIIYGNGKEDPSSLQDCAKPLEWNFVAIEDLGIGVRWDSPPSPEIFTQDMGSNINDRVF